MKRLSAYLLLSFFSEADFEEREELEELEMAKKKPITFDSDCPETTPERAIKFRRVNPPRSRVDAHRA